MRAYQEIAVWHDIADDVRLRDEDFQSFHDNSFYHRLVFPFINQLIN